MKEGNVLTTVPMSNDYRNTIALHERRTERFVRRFAKKY